MKEGRCTLGLMQLPDLSVELLTALRRGEHLQAQEPEQKVNATPGRTTQEVK